MRELSKLPGSVVAQAEKKSGGTIAAKRRMSRRLRHFMIRFWRFIGAFSISIEETGRECKRTDPGRI